MECKQLCIDTVYNLHSRINRYIMECKLKNIENQIKARQELIDTLWNVNERRIADGKLR